MADQTTMNRNGKSPVRVRLNLAELAHDAVTLVELQVQLLAVDMREARRGVNSALLSMIAGASAGIGCVPLLLMAAAHALIEVLSWPASWAYAATGVAAMVVAMLLLWTGWRKSARALATVQRSQTEFQETLRWLKGSLHPSRTRDFDDDAHSEGSWRP